MQRNLSGCPILSLSVRGFPLHSNRLASTNKEFTLFPLSACDLGDTPTRRRQRKLATSQQLCPLGFATKNDVKFVAVVTLSACLGINCIHVRRSVYANPKMPDLRLRRR